MNFRPKITKEQIATLPLVVFEGEIVVVETAQQVAEACAELNSERIIGFDTESRPAFKKGVVNKIALLQLSTSSRCFLFRLNRTGLTGEIVKVLENKRLTKVGLSVAGDIRELATIGRFRPAGFIDLQTIAPQHGIEDMSLAKIAAIVLGGRISKAQRLSNWESATLTPEQKKYAATDAWVSLEIYNKLIQSSSAGIVPKDSCR